MESGRPTQLVGEVYKERGEGVEKRLDRWGRKGRVRGVVEPRHATAAIKGGWPVINSGIRSRTSRQTGIRERNAPVVAWGGEGKGTTYGCGEDKRF